MTFFQYFLHPISHQNDRINADYMSNPTENFQKQTKRILFFLLK